MGGFIDQDLAEFTAKWTAEWTEWKNSRDPYSRSEQEQMTLILSNPWPSEQLIMRYMNDHTLHPTTCDFNHYGPTFYDHSLAKELYNAGGISDRVMKMVAFRRVGWKIKAHGESVVGPEDQDGIMRCMNVHFYIYDHITYLGYKGLARIDPDKISFTSKLRQAWDGIGQWRVLEDRQPLP